jgi:hypothetical protein
MFVVLRVGSTPVMIRRLNSLPYVPGRVHMESVTEGCLYPKLGSCLSIARVTVKSIPPEPQLSWLSGKYMIVPF